MNYKITMIWVMLSILVLLILFLVLFIYLRKGKKHKPNYYSLFIIGFVWFVLGVPTKNDVLWILGITFMVIGLIHKNEWKDYKRIKLSELTKGERKMRMIMLIGLAVLVTLGLIVLILNKGGI